MSLVYYLLEVGLAKRKVSGVTKMILEPVKRNSGSSIRLDSSWIREKRVINGISK